MDGDKYNKEIINYIKLLSNLDNTEETLITKHKICILVNGQSKNENNSFKWNRSISSEKEDIVYKPQFFHSSAAIFMLIKYPHLRKNDSFINIIIESNLIEECLKIATDVLMSDKDGIDFVRNSDIIFNRENRIIIVDETNDH
jgi:hypothetical protein